MKLGLTPFVPSLQTRAQQNARQEDERPQEAVPRGQRKGDQRDGGGGPGHATVPAFVEPDIRTGDGGVYREGQPLEESN